MAYQRPLYKPNPFKSARGRKVLSEEEVAPTTTPTDSDVSFLAGFFEGEGHIEKNTDRVKLVIGQQESEVLDYLRQRFGGKVYLTDKAITKSGRMYYWRINDGLAMDMIGAIYSMLFMKKRQIAEVYAELGIETPDTESQPIEEQPQIPEGTDINEVIRRMLKE